MEDDLTDFNKELEMDSKGNVVTRPILGWITTPVAGMAVLLQLKYAEKPEEVETGGRRLQTIMTPQQALELGEMLTRQAQRILGEKKNPSAAN